MLSFATLLLSLLPIFNHLGITPRGPSRRRSPERSSGARQHYLHHRRNYDDTNYGRTDHRANERTDYRKHEKRNSYKPPQKEKDRDEIQGTSTEPPRRVVERREGQRVPEPRAAKGSAREDQREPHGPVLPGTTAREHGDTQREQTKRKDNAGNQPRTSYGPEEQQETEPKVARMNIGQGQREGRPRGPAHGVRYFDPSVPFPEHQVHYEKLNSVDDDKRRMGTWVGYRNNSIANRREEEVTKIPDSPHHPLSLKFADAFEKGRQRLSCPLHHLMMYLAKYIVPNRITWTGSLEAFAKEERPENLDRSFAILFPKDLVGNFSEKLRRWYRGSLALETLYSILTLRYYTDHKFCYALRNTAMDYLETEGPDPFWHEDPGNHVDPRGANYLGIVLMCIREENRYTDPERLPRPPQQPSESMADRTQRLYGTPEMTPETSGHGTKYYTPQDPPIRRAEKPRKNTATLPPGYVQVPLLPKPPAGTRWTVLDRLVVLIPEEERSLQDTESDLESDDPYQENSEKESTERPDVAGTESDNQTTSQGGIPSLKIRLAAETEKIDWSQQTTQAGDDEAPTQTDATHPSAHQMRKRRMPIAIKNIVAPPLSDTDEETPTASPQEPSTLQIQPGEEEPHTGATPDEGPESTALTREELQDQTPPPLTIDEEEKLLESDNEQEDNSNQMEPEPELDYDEDGLESVMTNDIRD